MVLRVKHRSLATNVKSFVPVNFSMLPFVRPRITTHGQTAQVVCTKGDVYEVKVTYAPEADVIGSDRWLKLVEDTATSATSTRAYCNQVLEQFRAAVPVKRISVTVKCRFNKENSEVSSRMYVKDMSKEKKSKKRKTSVDNDPTEEEEEEPENLEL